MRTRRRAADPAQLDVLESGRAVCEMFDFLEDVVFWIKDSAGRYRWVNAANFLALGQSRREDVLGKTDFDLLPGHIAAQFQADDQRVLRGETIAERIELIGGFDHTARWSLTFKRPLRDARGRIVGTVGFTRPVTEARERWDDMPLGAVVAFVRDRFHEPLDNRALARVAGLSQRTFERRFRRYYGVSPRQYVKRVRVRTACRALVYTDDAIAQIAVAHGFPDQSYFTREFREVIGTTPREYRKSFKRRGEER
jgi:AraC-like DNA-binding protein